jgi:methionyl aminopeptidase
LKKFRGIFIKNEHEIGLLREANRIVAEILEAIGEKITPGMLASEIERLANEICDKYKVKPAFLGYCGFPHSICCSVNEEIVHGFPTDRELKDGDIVSFDMGTVYKGFHGDAARTYAVGNISPEAKRLMEATKSSLEKGIEQALPGNDLYDISRAVETEAKNYGYHIIKRFVGHGIGAKLHERPEIPNFVPRRSNRIPLKSGMTLAIEPMLAVGTDEVKILDDKWTAVTKDGSLSAHFENTIAITNKGPQILSKL